MASLPVSLRLLLSLMLKAPMMLAELLDHAILPHQESYPQTELLELLELLVKLGASIAESAGERGPHNVVRQFLSERPWRQVPLPGVQAAFANVVIDPKPYVMVDPERLAALEHAAAATAAAPPAAPFPSPVCIHCGRRAFREEEPPTAPEASRYGFQCPRCDRITPLVLPTRGPDMMALECKWCEMRVANLTIEGTMPGFVERPPAPPTEDP